jgi:hypothetical protein
MKGELTMKKAVLGILVLFMAVSLSACNTADTPNSYKEESSTTVTESHSDGENSTNESNGSLAAGEEIGGGNPSNACLEHCFSFHSIDIKMINECVGQDLANAWEAKERALGHRISILSFIKEFEIPKDVLTYYARDCISDSLFETLGLSAEEYYQEYGYTLEQIDALYSGDESRINKAFCGPLAVYNDKDGKLYSIEWLSEHDASDYVEAGLPLDEVESVIELAQTGEYIEYASMAETAQDTMIAAVALEVEMINSQTESKVSDSSETGSVSDDSEVESTTPDSSETESTTLDDSETESMVPDDSEIER